MFVKRRSGKFEDEFLSFLQAKQIYGEYQTLDERSRPILRASMVNDASCSVWVVLAKTRPPSAFTILGVKLCVYVSCSSSYYVVYKTHIIVKIKKKNK